MITDSDIRYAREGRHRRKTPYPTDALSIVVQGLAELKRRGIKISAKKPWSILPHLTTAYRRRIRVAHLPDDEKSDVRAEGRRWGHELVHYVQREDDGPNRFALRYAFSRKWRLRYEWEAYIESAIIMRAQGYRIAQIDDYLGRVVALLGRSILRGGYGLDLRGRDAAVFRQVVMEIVYAT